MHVKTYLYWIISIRILIHRRKMSKLSINYVSKLNWITIAEINKINLF